MDEPIVPQRAQSSGLTLTFDEWGEGVHREVPARGRSPSSRIPRVFAERAAKKRGGTCRIRYPRRFYGGYRGVRGVYLNASGDGDVEGQAPGVIYNK